MFARRIVLQYHIYSGNVYSVHFVSSHCSLSTHNYFSTLPLLQCNRLFEDNRKCTSLVLCYTSPAIAVIFKEPNGFKSGFWVFYTLYILTCLLFCTVSVHLICKATDISASYILQMTGLDMAFLTRRFGLV